MYINKESLRNQKVLLYGAGNLGKKLYRCFKDSAIPVEGLIDKRAMELKSSMEHVFDLADTSLDPYMGDSIVILAGLFGLSQEKSIRRALEERGFSSIYALREIDWRSFQARDFLKNLFIGDFQTESLKNPDVQRKINEVFSLFSQKKEREYIRRYIEAHRLQNYGGFPTPLALELQYLAQGLGETLNLECFVDAGAYDGDVLRRFRENGLTVGTYIAFDPQGELCHRIFDTVSSETSPERGMIFPCGLSDRWERIGFSVSSDGMSASKADAEGIDRIQCVPLDEALLGVRPTLIKMDIEGMELKALRGAANTIRKCHPQLAICVYHELSHIWEIPLYIKSLYDGYRFHIHNYQYMGLETVVYAFS